MVHVRRNIRNITKKKKKKSVSFFWFPCDIFFLLFYKLKDKKKKYEPPVPTRVGKKKKKTKGPDAASKLPLGNACSSAVPSPQGKDSACSLEYKGRQEELGRLKLALVITPLYLLTCL